MVEFPSWNRTRLAWWIRRLSLPTWILPLGRIFARVRAEGLEHLERLDRPVIFAVNHQSHFDVPVVLMALPPRLRYRVAPAMAKEFFKAHFFPAQYGHRAWLTNSLNYYLAALFFNAFPLPLYPFKAIIPFAGAIVLLQGLAEIALQLDKPEDALTHYTHLLEHGDASSDILYNCGVLSQQMGDSSEAVRFYEAALEKEPNFAEALLNLGHALKESGDVEEAKSFCTAFCSISGGLANRCSSPSTVQSRSDAPMRRCARKVVKPVSPAMVTTPEESTAMPKASSNAAPPRYVE